jgi:hypothetical protein
MQVFVKNIGPNDAVGAFTSGPEFRFVPEQKMGASFLDNPPEITPEACSVRPKPKSNMRMFPVERGSGVAINISGGLGTEALEGVKSLSVRFGGPQPEPVPSDDHSPGIHVAPDARFQLYAPVCIYYQDVKEHNFGYCANYRFVVENPSDPNDPSGFSCRETPVRGEFERQLMNYCEN